MAHIIINPSLSAAIGYNIFFNPPKFSVVIAILEPANSTRTDNSMHPGIDVHFDIVFLNDHCGIVLHDGVFKLFVNVDR